MNSDVGVVWFLLFFFGRNACPHSTTQPCTSHMVGPGSRIPGGLREREKQFEDNHNAKPPKVRAPVCQASRADPPIITSHHHHTPTRRQAGSPAGPSAMERDRGTRPRGRTRARGFAYVVASASDTSNILLPCNGRRGLTGVRMHAMRVPAEICMQTLLGFPVYCTRVLHLCYQHSNPAG